MQPATTPGGITSISSSPEAGIVYRFAAWSDFTPEVALSEDRQWSGGVYTSVASDFLTTEFELPDGALVHDVEWYLSNSVTATAHTSIWMSGSVYFSTAILAQTIAAASGLHAARDVVPAAANGPFPHGCKLRCAMSTPVDGSVLLHGVRVGFLHAPRQTVLRNSAVRLYNSTQHTPLANGATRTIGVGTHVPTLAGGVLLAVKVFDTQGAGTLNIGATSTTANIAAAVWNRTGDRAVAHVTSPRAADGSFVVHAAGGSTDFTVDLLGYLL